MKTRVGLAWLAVSCAMLAAGCAWVGSSAPTPDSRAAVELEFIVSNTGTSRLPVMRLGQDGGSQTQIPALGPGEAYELTYTDDRVRRYIALTVESTGRRYLVWDSSDGEYWSPSDFGPVTRLEVSASGDRLQGWVRPDNPPINVAGGAGYPMHELQAAK